MAVNLNKIATSIKTTNAVKKTGHTCKWLSSDAFTKSNENKIEFLDEAFS